MIWTRRILIAVGAAAIALGAVVLASDQTVPQIVGVGAWLIAAIVIHDGVLAPVAFGVDVVLRRTGRRIRPVYLVVAQVAVVVGAVLTLVVAPEIRATTIGNPNPTVVPFDYGVRLAWMWAALAVLTALVCLAIALGSRSRRAGSGDGSRRAAS
ncbi:hypothetical protein ACFJGV_01390 [Cnuibacter sp. UC19_7]|uniref:hypothetical protein n=1 Tax=Cnuibacter sp. UC19_7 TaxID=3350166 RepID=UPI003671D335